MGLLDWFGDARTRTDVIKWEIGVSHVLAYIVSSSP
jgi:hypothetical protein